jgi:hypothetical protein
MAAAKFRYLISPVLAAGDHFLVRRPRSGPAKPSRSDGSAGRPARGGRELDNREPGKMAEPGSLCLPCEPTVVASPAACGPARGGRPPIQADMIMPGSRPGGCAGGVRGSRKRGVSPPWCCSRLASRSAELLARAVGCGARRRSAMAKGDDLVTGRPGAGRRPDRQKAVRLLDLVDAGFGRRHTSCGPLPAPL